MVKIYVGKLTSGVTNANLRSLFEPFGTVTDAERVRNKDIGFVHMDNEREAALAVRKLNRTSFMGSSLNVQLSQVKVQKLFIGNLPPDCTSDEIAAIFESYGAKVANAESCGSKRFGFVRIENDKGFSHLNNIIRSVNDSTYKGRTIHVELSEDLTKEQKDQRRAEREAQEALEWEQTPVELRAAPGFDPYPQDNNGGFSGGFARGRGLGRGRGVGDYWPQGSHSNKMPSRGAPGGFGREVALSGGFGRGEPGGFGRGAPGGLLPAPHGRGGPGNQGMGHQQQYPYPMPGSDLALDFGGGYEQSKSVATTEGGKSILNDYYSMMFENFSRSQIQLFESGDFSDYVIQCEGTEFKVHRVVLGPKSTVLMNVMSKCSSPMLIRDVDSSTLQDLLRFMYSGRIDVEGINPAKIMKLLTAADLYQVENVREGLEATLMENVNEDTAVDYLIFSEELQLSNLRLEVGKYICRNSKQFKTRPDFKKLSQYPHLVMELFDHASNF